MKRFYLLAWMCIYAFSSYAQNKAPDLIPYPASLEMKEGSFTFSPATRIHTNAAGQLEDEIACFQSFVTSLTGQTLEMGEGSQAIELELLAGQQHAEGYTLDITPGKVKIAAVTPAGIFYGLQTLRQLLLLDHQSGNVIMLPALHIADQPAFGWRGSMIDVSRHFYTLDYLKKHIDRLAFYKMNKLHLHLTDDQGWRIEIKKYPDLTAKGAYRTFNNHDSLCIKLAAENPDFEIDPRFITERNGEKIYGGYYTQEQLRELVAYAAQRHVEVIPEIDMPGHMMAAITAYPFLTDSEHIGWGKQFSIPVCPCKEEVYTFIQDVIEEVCTIFTSDYIHVGADEVEKTTWEASELCQALMEREGLADVNQLQSYFVHRVQEIVEAKGKKLIGWDEVLEGGINSDITVMYWRGWVSDAPYKSVMNGNEVIMSPTNPLYFDFLPDKSSLRNIYTMDIIYKDIPAGKEHLIQGAQANLWAERIPSEARAEFLLFPRILALAERTWTYETSSFDCFSQRIIAHYPLLDAMGISYRLPDLCGFALESVYIDEATFHVVSPLADKYVYYTTDGTVPTKQATLLTGPLTINQPTTIKFALFSADNARGDIYTVNYQPTTLAAPVAVTTPSDGLTCEFYDLRIDNTTQIAGEPTKRFTVKNIVVPDEVKAPSFGLHYNGYIEVPETGIYSFYFTCDDAGMLYIADRLVIDNEGPHSPVEKSGQVALEKGIHPFRLDFVEGGGGYTLLLQYSMDGCQVKDIPDAWFKH
ncbi:MAG: family 20 glycosylhydrolase [Tannerellaceae bacterium]|nr:family 20 glycosylhydrolase [Tannerellaceae bacterium]